MLMTRLLSLIITLVLSIAVAALHIAGETYFFYWTYWWYDIIVHGLGGVAIGSLLASAYHARDSVSLPRFLFIVGVTFAIGIVWEVFEYVIKSQQYEAFDPYVLDTAMDLGMDTAGGMFAYLLSKRLV
jgi:hypothetical protein